MIQAGFEVWATAPTPATLAVVTVAARGADPEGGPTKVLVKKLRSSPGRDGRVWAAARLAETLELVAAAEDRSAASANEDAWFLAVTAALDAACASFFAVVAIPACVVAVDAAPVAVVALSAASLRKVWA